jgi:quercetin dioxygenase-like cupin family protein
MQGATRWFRWSGRIVFLLAALVLAASPASNAQGRRASMETEAEPQGAAPPDGFLPEMKKLSFLLGTWQATDSYEKTPFAPNGGSGSGTYETTLGPGGASLLTDYRYQGPQGESSGHQVITWDPKRDQYMGYVVTSRSPGGIVVSGNWEGESLALSGAFEMRGMKVVFKQVFSDITGDSMLLRQFNRVEGGPSLLFGTTQFTKTARRSRPGKEAMPQTHSPDSTAAKSLTEVDNDVVRAIRMHIEPHEKLSMHDMSARVVVWLTDARLRLTLADGSTKDIVAKAGQAGWFEAQRHAGENLSGRPIEFVAIVPKR